MCCGIKDHCNFTPIRVYNPEIKKERSHSGEFYSRKMNRNVFYESKLEKHFFKRLEQSDVVRAYCEQPFKVPYEHHGSHYYVPDVLVCLTDGQCFVTEIKPLLMMVSKEVMTKYQALHDFCNQRGWGTLLSDGVHDIFDLFHFTPNLSLERAILRELSLNRTLMKKDLDRLKETHQGNSIQVAQCILRYKLSYRPVPMLVWKTKEALFCPILQRNGEEKTNDRILEQNTF